MNYINRTAHNYLHNVSSSILLLITFVIIVRTLKQIQNQVLMYFNIYAVVRDHNFYCN
jgi:hypothetical protein